MNNKSLSTGLWNRESKNGRVYASGKINLDNKEYKITLFTNNDKKNDKSPDYNIIIEEYTFNQNNIEKSQEEPKNSELDVYKQFGEQVEIDMSDELPF